MHLLRDKLQFVNTIAHEGKVVVVATDTDGKIWYTIKQDGFEDSYLNTPEDQRTGWEDWQELEFPNEAQDDQSVIDKETKELTHQADTSTFILRTRYRTQNESAAFPVQLVSATGHLYVFRQSKADSSETTPNTLLVDRFVLDGMTNQLVRKLDVRFKRSRQKYQPIASMKKNANGGLSNIDSLDYRDADGKSFYEPTTELTLIDNLHQGGFSVVLLPTNEHDNYRWHIFAYNSQTQKVELTSIRASAEGLFDFKDYTVLEPRPEAKNALIPRSIPGIIKRKLDLNGVEVANGLSATKYDIQKEQQTKDGMQLLKDSTKVMLAIPTKQGNVAALSFAVAADGTLSEIDENPDNTEILRSNSRDLLLPLNTLDEIQAIGDSTPPPQAKITGIERGYEDRVQIVSSPSSGLKTGDTVKISNTQSYNGHYQVISIDGDTFEIAAEWVNSEIGSWEVVPKTETGLVFDGMITNVERVADGKLHITAFNHGLEAGDELQIVDTTGYDGTYGVTKIDDENFTINDLFWKAGEAVNLKLESRKRRGVMFNGVDEYIKTPALELTPPSEEFSFGYTCSAWVYVSATGSGEQILLGEEDEHIQLLVNNGTVTLKVKCDNGVGLTKDTTTIPTGQWVHYAGIISSDAASDKTTLTLCKNGQQVGTPTEVASLFDPPNNWQPEFLIGKSIAGKIADVQVWDKVRTVKEIKDSMYLQLTGREVDLVGYWRLGAITGGKERTVVDFSVYGNDGTVYGDAFVSAITLSRTLGDGTTQAVKYSNDDLVAVSARATYIETFEFKTNPNVNPNNVDGQNGKLFTFSYWGKKSRSAFERIEHKLFTIDTSDFQSLGNDWYKATCRFTVPDGVAMIRSFELGNVQGTWSTLEIRKHRVQLVSDSITEVNYTDSVSLSTLADNYAELPGQLKTLEQKEQEEAKLLKEKRELEDKIALLDDLPRLRQEVAALETEVASLQQEDSTLKTEYEEELDNPLNYECYLSIKVGGSWKGVYIQNTGVGIGYLYCKSGDGNLFRFQREGDGDLAYLEIKVEHNWKRIYINSQSDEDNQDTLLELTRNGLPKSTLGDGTGNLFKLEKQDNYYYFQAKVGSSWKWMNAEKLYSYSDERLRRHSSIRNLFDIIRTHKTTNNRIQTAETAWENKQEELTPKQDELTKLQDLLNAGISEKSTLEALLQDVNNQLTQVQSELNTANNTVINTVSTTQQTPQTLPTLHTVSHGSQKGLVTKGSLLGFASPATRIAAIETCEGNVQLSYFDNQGRMRQTNFDATSDSRNTTFEQWLPDELPVALNFADSNDKIELANPVVLGKSWTVETWFSFPFAAMEKPMDYIYYFKQKLLATDPEASDEFGRSVAISDNIAIVGACNQDTGGTDPGAAYIFERDSSGTWIQTQKLLASDPEADDNFGRSVAISGNIAIVGANAEDTGGSDAGAAYIFERDSSGTWIQTQKLLASDPEADDRFGYSVAISGNIAIIGASAEDTGGSNAGAAYIFERDSSGTWTQTQKLLASDPEADDNFGRSVAISGNIAIVGANREDTGGSEAGAAYIFERDSSSTWTQTQKLLASDPEADDDFGYSVAISGNIAIVGAYAENTGGSYAGAAYIFERDSNGTWTQTQKLLASDPEASDCFGYSVAISGNIAIVGAFAESTGAINAGAAYIFERDSSGTWTQTQKLLASDPEADDRFGYSVAISGNIAIVGAFAEDTEGSNAGAAYIFEATVTYKYESEPARKILLGSTDDSSPVVIEEKSKLGTRVNGTFYDSGYSLERLTPGWHHLTAVGKDSNTIFYIDGRQVADVKQAYIDAATDDAIKEERKTEICQATGINISTIGNSTTGSEQFGKLAEVRVWNLALSKAEIAINSKTRLSGNEPGLVAYYPLNEATGTEVRDLTGRSNTGSSNTGSSNTGSSNNSTDTDAATIEHLEHKVMEFDGVDDYVEIAAHKNPTTAITVSLWAKSNTENWTNAGFLASKRNAYILFPVKNSKSIRFYIYRSKWQYIEYTLCDINQWHNYAGTFDGTTLKLFIDGVEVASKNVAGVIKKDTGKLCLGRDDGQSRYLNGQIAEVRIWNKARTAEEIQADMYKRLTGQESGLVGYWQLNQIQTEGDQEKVLDLTGNNNGTLKGAILKDDKTLPISSNTDSGNSGTVPIDNQGHKVMEFDGVDDYVEIAAHENPTTAITVSLWAKSNTENWNSEGFLVSKRDAYIMHPVANKKSINFLIYNNTWPSVGAEPYNINQWHHYAGTFDGTTLKLYIDGVEVASKEITTTIKVDKGALYIGWDDGIKSRYFNGQIAEVRIWNKARTVEEIQADMYKRLTGQESGLVGYWQLNEIQTEGDQQKVLDLTGNNNGTVKGAILKYDKTLPISSNTDSANSGTVPISTNTDSANSSTVNDAISGNKGTVMGAIWWGCAAPIGNLGHKVMQFDGVDDYVSLPAEISSNISNQITLEAWVYCDTLSEESVHRGIVTNVYGSNKVIFQLCLNGSDHKLQAGFYNGAWKQQATDSSFPMNQWVHVAASYDGVSIKIYQNGSLIKQSANLNSSLPSNTNEWRIGRRHDKDAASDMWNGPIAEVRIWNKARTAEEIKADMYQRLTGQESGLVGYWPLNHIEPEGDTIKVRDLTDNNHGTVKGAILKDDNTLPIGSNALVSAEYNTITIDKVTNRKSALMRRFLASPTLNGVELLPDKRIETLELKWIGNAQFAPTLLGYIEGAPPIPSENLTVDIDYTSATAVELAISEDVEFSWNRSQDAGLGANIEGFIGTAGEVYAGLGVETQVGEWKAGFAGNLDFSYQWQNESNITSSSALSMSDLLELRGTPESTVKFPHLGQRFIPKNVGYALVVSSLADVFITRLQRSKKMIGYQVQPVDGIPPDVNTITFLINPAYTMNGSLDGMTGSSASSDRFFRHVPEMRAQYGSLYPASYYRLQEAYDLKQQIENEDKRRESYFAQFNAGLVDETSLNREIDSGDAPQTIGVTREEDKPDEELTEEEKQAAQERQKEQFEQEAGAAAEQQSEAAQQKQKEIDTKITDQETRVHATDSFAGWQKRMENIQIRAGKRNIVNTYVWDADGGMRAEAQSFANTAEHTVGGSFILNAGLGFLGEFTAGGLAAELTAQATINMTQTMSKTEARSKGIELYVDTSGVESKAITDENDYPLQPGEKVDRYRFMTFYLEGSTQNFNDFFTYVVDPEWLASNDEEARALRQAKGKANKTWRVLHRVTYVERPALMGFARDVHQTSSEDGVAIAVVNYFQDISQKQKVLETKVDQLLTMLKDIKS
ncbi:LamG-like jellyroll fold domain-containing protein [Moorena producens]|uniref:LamG-like jellyroll fold domain-containing protein n=1 Tax=Moorena producens TaxID=1155739 RepID=UPI003C7325D7